MSAELYCGDRAARLERERLERRPWEREQLNRPNGWTLVVLAGVALLAAIAR